ncbi:MAG: TetR/AcrR family transcriptional regulator [Neisseriaceae bacterium]|nr:TetR/AcrR family transcriptional regulator [Neisseriaceae bacterium]
MTRKTRAETKQETRTKLLATARQWFTEKGYADTVMDELTAAAGLTRGALYHHFGNKEGLFLAVALVLDEALNQRLDALAAAQPSAWMALLARCDEYLAMSLEPEVQRILLRDAPAVLSADDLEASRRGCVLSLQSLLQQLQAEGILMPAPVEMQATMLNGALMEASFRIGRVASAETALVESQALYRRMLAGFRGDQATGATAND